MSVTIGLGLTNLVAQALECPAVVVGTNDAATDVLNVQQAVDECASVLLQGKFRFAGMSTGEPLRVVTIRRSVNIVGQPDDAGRTPLIVGGSTPLLVDAPGAVVRIKGLRFLRPVSRAIQVGSALEAVVANCVIEGVEPVTIGDLNVAFGILVGGAFESPINRLVASDNTIADPGKPVEVGILLVPSRAIGSISIYRNELRATAHGIDLRFVGGSAHVNNNRITIDNSARTGDADPPRFVDGIRCWGGACSIVGNSIESNHPNSSGVRLQAAAGAIVENNDIQMSPPTGSAPGAQSSGVQVVEDSKRNLIARNRVSGAARTAFSVSGPLPLVPTDNVLVLNRHPEFVPSFVDSEVGEGALRTVLVGESGSISDLGTGTVVR